MATYAGRYDEPLLKYVGGRLVPASSATVTVYEDDGSTVATLYTDRSKATTLDNPVSPDASGNLQFFADPGVYVLSVSEGGSVQDTHEVTVTFDPDEVAGDLTAAEIVAEFSGTPDGTQFLRDDGTLATPAGGGGATNLAWNAGTSTVTSDTGTDATLSAVDGTNPGLMTVAQKSKLDGIETGATADQSAAEILTAVKTVDGAGSGLDADTVDGQEASAFQPVDADLTTLAGAGNSAVLAATTASFTTADETKLDGIEVAADVTDATNVAAAGAVMAQSTVTKLYGPITQAAYDALTPAADTLYVIVG